MSEKGSSYILSKFNTAFHTIWKKGSVFDSSHFMTAPLLLSVDIANDTAAFDASSWHT